MPLLERPDPLAQLLEKMAEVHVGHDHVVLDVHHQGADEVQALHVGLGQQAVVQAVADAARVLAQKEAPGLVQGRLAAHHEHAAQEVALPAGLPLLGRVVADRDFILDEVAAEDGGHVEAALGVGGLRQAHRRGRRFRLGQHAPVAGADQLQRAAPLLADVQVAGQARHHQGHGHADAVKVLQGLELLGQIEKSLEKIVAVAGEVVAGVVGRLFVDAAHDGVEIGGHGGGRGGGHGRGSWLLFVSFALRLRFFEFFASL